MRSELYLRLTIWVGIAVVLGALAAAMHGCTIGPAPVLPASDELPPTRIAAAVPRWSGTDVSCTAVLVAPRIVVTAGHCLTMADGPEAAITWGPLALPVLETYLVPGADMAVGLLEAETIARPLPWNTRYTPWPGEPVTTYGWGCSGGQWLEAHRGTVRGPVTSVGWDVDGFACHGDSGGPVVTMGGVVIGLVDTVDATGTDVGVVSAAADSGIDWTSWP